MEGITHRRYIYVPTPNGPEDFSMRIAMFDQAAPGNLIFEPALTGLDCEIRPYQGKSIRGVGFGSWHPIGTVTLEFEVRGNNRRHEEEFDVLSEACGAWFDVVLGDAWVQENYPSQEPDGS